MLLIFVPAAREMLTSKNEKAAPDVQERLNAVWDLLLELPPYRDIDLDIKTAYHMFPLLVSDSENGRRLLSQAQEWKGLAEQGKLSDSELREKLAGL